MSEIFPKLISTLQQSNGVRATPAIQSVEAIKNEILGKFESFTKGSVLRAEVIAALKDGSYVVNVEELPLRLSLPSAVKVGDMLNLNLLQLHPTPLFELENGQVAGLIAPQMNRNGQLASEDKTLANTPRNNAHLPFVTSDEIATNTHHPQFANSLGAKQFAQSYQSQQKSSDIQLSEMAQIIGTVLRDSERSKQKLALQSSTPLTDDITAKLNPRSLAQRLESQLHKQIENSGLSYETHVAQWANGERSVEQLKLEPQGLIDLKFESSVLTDEKIEQHQQLTELVHQQLDVIDGFGLNWQGLLSPSIPLHLNIKPEATQDQSEEPKSDSGDMVSNTCHSTMELDFPRLGKIKIEIHFHDNHSDIRCTVSSPDVIEKLHQEARQLIDALNARGQKLQSMKVSVS